MSREDESSHPSTESTGWVMCPVCSGVIKTRGKYAHFKTAHPDLDYQEYKDKFKPVAKPETEDKEEEAPPEVEERRLVAQFGRDGLNRIKRDRLRKVLELAPDIGKKTTPYVMHKWEINTRLRDDPNELFNMLHYEVGLKPNIATSIVKDVFSVEQEFADLLQRKGEQPIFLSPQPPGSPGWGQPFYGWTGPWVSPTQTPFQPSQLGMPSQPSQYAPFLTREEFYRSQREEAERSRIDKIESEMRGLRDDLPKLIKDALPPTDVEGQYIIEEIPLDRAGNPCPPDKAVSISTRRIPFKDRGLTAEDVRRIVEDSRPKLTAEDVRKIVREEKGEKPPSIQEDPVFKDLRSRLDQAEKRYDELKDSIEKSEREELRAQLNKLGEELSRTRTTSGEWKTDEGKAIGIGLDRVGSALEKLAGKEPLSRLERIISPGFSSENPPSAEAEEGAKPRLDELRREGLVVSLVDRVRGKRT